MPTPDDWSREVDDALFGDAASESPPRAHWPGSLEFPQSPEAQSPPRRDVPIEALDNELFGRTETNVPSEPDAQDPLVPPDVTAPAIMPIILDEDEPEVIANEWPGERGAPAGGRKRGRRRALAGTVLLALVVAVGVTIGAMALTRSSGHRPAVNTGSDRTTTTSTTTPVATTVPAPQTSPPPDSQPSPTTRPAPRTTPGPRAPGAAPTEPPPPDPEPPPPQPPPPPPPTTSPPPTTLVPPAT